METVEADDKTTRKDTENVGEDWDKQGQEWEGHQEIKGETMVEWYICKYIPTL